MAPLLARPRASLDDPLQGDLQRYLLTGDEAALERVVESTRPRLIAAARRIGDPQDAEDSVQSAYLSLMRHRGSGLEAPVMPWLITTVIRIAYRRKAVNRRQDEIARLLSQPRDGAPPAPPGPDLAAMTAEEAGLLRREVERLPDRYRDPVVLHYLHGLPTPEVARLLDLPEPTVRTRLRRARLILRSRLPAGLLLGLLALPWFLKDAAHGAGSALGLAAAGGIVTTGGAVGIGLVAALAGAFLGAKLLAGKPPEPPAAPGPSLADAVQKERERVEAASATSLESLRKELAAAKEQSAKDAAERDELRKSVEDLKAQAAAAAAKPAAPPSEPKVASGPRFSFGEYDACLKEVDWKSVGTSTKTMAPLIAELREASKKGGPPPMDLIGKVQQHNSSLVMAALKVNEKLPGSGINGSYTHPAFMSNAMASTLEAAGLPLAESQADALGRIGREFTDRDRARLAGYDDATYRLQRVLDEADLKEKFFDQAFALLTPEQNEALRPAGTRGLTSLDLFSPGLMLAQHIAPVRAKDREEFLTKLQATAVERLAVPADRRTDFAEAVRQWGADLPEEWFAQDTELLVGAQPMFKVATVQELGKRELALLRKCAEEMGMPEETLKAARSVEGVFVPLVRKQP